MKQIRKRAVPAAALLVLLFFSGCNRAEKAEGGPAAEEAPAPVFAVNTTPAVQGQIRDYLALSGDIVAGSTVDAYSEVAGKITRLYVSVGSRVRKDQPLAEVDPSRPGMSFLPGIAGAPLAGTIVSLPAQVGMTVSQGVPIARIAGGNALEIRLYVAERFISKMAMNLPCEITLDAWPGEIFQGSVSEVAPTVDPASRTMEVRVNVSNAGSKLKAGMFAKVRIITERKDNIVKIPSAALMQRFGENYVFVAEELPPEEAEPVKVEAVVKQGFFAKLFGKKDEIIYSSEIEVTPSKQYAAKKRIVTPGILIDGVLEIQQGLESGEEVVVRGQTLIEEGSRINIVEQFAPLGAN